MNLDRLHNPNLKIPTVITGGIVLAIFSGLWIGSGNFTTVAKVFLGLVVLSYVLFGLQQTLRVAIFGCFLQFLHIGFGFAMTESEFSLVLGGLLFAFTWWRKKKLIRPTVLEHWSYGFLMGIIFMWLAYVTCHTLYNIYDPYRPQDFALKNMLKAAVGWIGPLALVWYFARRPGAIIVPENFPVTLARIFTCVLCMNIFVRLIEIVFPRPEAVGDNADMAPYLLVPLLNVMPSVYALRWTTPAIALFCMAFLLRNSRGQQFGESRKWFVFGLVLSTVGAALSGGRATVAFVFCLIALLMLVRGRFGELFLCVGAVVIVLGAMNAVPDFYESAPKIVQRSLNWGYFGKSREQTSEMIAGSTDWRKRLFMKALDEWRSDDRIFWFGRATYSFGVQDWMAQKILGEEGAIDSSLRRGATHNLITDLLVIYGLIGFVLYIFLYFAFFTFLWVLYRSPSIDENARTLTLVILGTLSFYFVYALFGGGNFPVTMTWMFVLLIAYLYRTHAQKAVTTEAKPSFAAIKPRTPERRAPIGPYIAR